MVKEIFKKGDCVILLSSLLGYKKGDVGIINRIHSYQYAEILVKNRISTSGYSPYVIYKLDEIRKVMFLIKHKEDRYNRIIYEIKGRR